MQLIDLQDVCVDREKKNTLTNISFSLKQGDCVALVGPNGAGKTTLLYVLLGFLPYKGSVIVNNRDKRIDSIGYAPDSVNLFDFYSGREHMLFWGKMKKMKKADIQKRAADLLQLVELREAKDQSSQHYSHGMRQRLSLAISLLHNPSVIVRDEPMHGLDPIGRDIVTKIMKQLQHEGKTILFTTHYLHDVTELANTFVIMDGGKIVDQGSIKKHQTNFSEHFHQKILH